MRVSGKRQGCQELCGTHPARPGPWPPTRRRAACRGPAWHAPALVARLRRWGRRPASTPPTARASARAGCGCWKGTRGSGGVKPGWRGRRPCQSWGCSSATHWRPRPAASIAAWRTWPLCIVWRWSGGLGRRVVYAVTAAIPGEHVARAGSKCSALKHAIGAGIVSHRLYIKEQGAERCRGARSQLQLPGAVCPRPGSRRLRIPPMLEAENDAAPCARLVLLHAGGVDRHVGEPQRRTVLLTLPCRWKWWAPLRRARAAVNAARSQAAGPVALKRHNAALGTSERSDTLRLSTGSCKRRHRQLHLRHHAGEHASVRAQVRRDTVALRDE